MFWKTLVVALFVVGVFAEEYQISEDNKDKLKEYLKKQCEKVSAGDKTDDVEAAVHSFVDCIKGLVNVDVLKNEIEDAKPKGALDEVFKKYCAKTPQLKTCIHTLLNGFEPCLDNTAKELLPSAKNGTDQLIDFVCYKDGDRIALFISEQGPECFNDKFTAIRACLDKIKETVSTAEAANALSLSDRCGKFDELSACVVTALEECSTPTPGNMAESLFRYVRKSSPCNTALPWLEGCRQSGGRASIPESNWNSSQLAAEKACVQKALLRMEAARGRPPAHSVERGAARHLYERYRTVKRVLASTRPDAGLRRSIKDYENSFERLNSRKVQRDDKKGREDDYIKYKAVKARIKLITALINKQKAL